MSFFGLFAWHSILFEHKEYGILIFKCLYKRFFLQELGELIELLFISKNFIYDGESIICFPIAFEPESKRKGFDLIEDHRFTGKILLN